MRTLPARCNHLTASIRKTAANRLCNSCRFSLPTQQLQVQLANALPYDLEETGLGEYKNLNPRWHDWLVVEAACSHLSARIFDRVCDMSADHSGNPEMNMKTTRKVRMGF